MAKSKKKVDENLELNKEGEESSLDLDFQDPLEILNNELNADLSEGFIEETTEIEIANLDPNELTELTPEQSELTPETQLTDEEAISILESLLFISDRPLGLTTFKNAFENTNVNTKKIKELIDELKMDLVQRRRGVTLEEVDGAYQLRTKVDNQDYIKKILKPKIFKLTGPSLETLSVIAYKQPCIKSQVDEVRGVESGHLIRALMDKGLVAFEGKSDLPGRPMLYKTTRKFLEIFGLRNLSELPSLSEIEELLPEGIGEDEDKETLSELAVKLEDEYGDQSYSIGEEELGKITEQLSGISTQTEFFEVEKQRQREARDRDRAEAIREALILEETVDPKDVKWLERYESKQASTDDSETSNQIDVNDVVTEMDETQAINELSFLESKDVSETENILDDIEIEEDISDKEDPLDLL